MYKFMKTKVGFTLVELMLVVVILGLIVCIGVPAYRNVTKNTRIKVCNITQKNVAADAKDWCIQNQFNDDFVFTIISDGATGSFRDGNGGNLSDDQVALLKNDVFNGDVPYCPGCGTITVVLEKNPKGPVKISVVCDGGNDGDCHKKEAK